MHKKIRLAIDMMGGDTGVEATIPAVLKLIKQHPQILCQVYSLPGLCDSLKIYDQISVVTCPCQVEMDESPIRALKSKRESTLYQAILSVKQGESDAVVSSGNTGAMMVMARSILKMIAGVDRPALMKILPGKNTPVYLLDVGATVDTTISQLKGFALLGASAFTAMESAAKPRVGLLSNGHEKIKGTQFLKDGYDELAQMSSINFHGYAEPQDIRSGEFDVIVTDGFSGNLVIKSFELMVYWMKDLVKAQMAKSVFHRVFLKIMFLCNNSWLSEINAEKYNGAFFLGVGGVVIKSHGGSNANAMYQAILHAIHFVEAKFPEKLQSQLNQLVENDKI
jgi:glycerol-3-phosphate acyltransferase PlsX